MSFVQTSSLFPFASLQGPFCLPATVFFLIYLFFKSRRIKLRDVFNRKLSEEVIRRHLLSRCYWFFFFLHLPSLTASLDVKLIGCWTCVRFIYLFICLFRPLHWGDWTPNSVRWSQQLERVSSRCVVPERHTVTLTLTQNVKDSWKEKSLFKVILAPIEPFFGVIF